jgi:hypothetical protein
MFRLHLSQNLHGLLHLSRVVKPSHHYTINDNIGVTTSIRKINMIFFMHREIDRHHIGPQLTSHMSPHFFLLNMFKTFSIFYICFFL